MADEPQVQAGFGGPDQLQYGQAAELNQGLEQARATQEPAAAPTEPPAQPSSPPQEPQAPPQAPELPPPVQPSPLKTDEDRALFGPTERPGEPIEFGQTAANTSPPPDTLPAVQLALQAAALPGATENIKTLATNLAFLYFRNK